MDRVAKLANMEMSILYLYNKDYVKFVNNTVNKLTKILATNSYIVQPYVISTSSNIAAIPIGGISLGSRFIDTNPLSRGYYFVVNTQGNSEELYAFYQFIKGIGEKEIRAFDYAEKHGENKQSDIKTTLDIIYNELSKNTKGSNIPVLLGSFNIDEKTGKYSYKTNNWFKDLKTSNNIPIYKIMSDYSFNAISAKDSQYPCFYSRSINKFQQVSQPVQNGIVFGKERLPCSINDRAEEYELPIYDFSTMFGPVEMAFVQPNGYKLLKIYTPNGELIKNNLFFIFTQYNTLIDENNDSVPKFNAYDTIQNGVSTGVVDKCGKTSANIFTTNLPTLETVSKRMSNVIPTRNNTFSTNRMKIIGKDTIQTDSHIKV